MDNLRRGSFWLWALIVAVTMSTVAKADQPLRVATPALSASLVNPFRTVAPPSIYVTSAIFDSLTRFDKTGALKPWLAISWNRESTLAWVFDLRQDVSFSNGELFNAEAVVATVSFLTSPEATLEGVRRELPFIEKAEVVNEHQVRIVTKTPIPLLPRYMAAMPIVAPQQWARLGIDGFAKEPVGTGPYRLVQKKANKLELVAFDKAWNPPRMPALDFTMVPTPTARISGLLSNVFDVALDLGPDDLRTLDETGNKSVVTITSSVTGITFFLKNQSPFSDLRVRQAVNLAVNRKAIIDSLLGGATRVSSQPVTSLALGYNPNIDAYPYDPTRAKALLAEAGYEKGFRFSFETSVGYAPNDAAIFQQIAQDLRAVGIQMNIVTLPISEFLSRRGNASIQSEAFAAEWPAWPTLDGLRAVRTHSCLREPIWYCDPTLTPFIEQALAEEDDAKALSLRQDIMRKVRDDAPALFLFEAPQFTGLRKAVEGYREDNNLINYSEIVIK